MRKNPSGPLASLVESKGGNIKKVAEAIIRIGMRHMGINHAQAANSYSKKLAKVLVGK